MAEGIDGRTRLHHHHLRAGDYSRWLGDSINDDGLAAEITEVQADRALDAGESRVRVKAAIERRYTGPV